MFDRVRPAAETPTSGTLGRDMLSPWADGGMCPGVQGTALYLRLDVNDVGVTAEVVIEGKEVWEGVAQIEPLDKHSLGVLGEEGDTEQRLEFACAEPDNIPDAESYYVRCNLAQKRKINLPS